MEFSILLRLVGVTIFTFILSCLSNIKGREPSYLISFLKQINFGLHSDIHILVSFKLGMMIETSKLYILISVRLH